MFPGVDGFHWTAGHVIFLCLFFIVVVTIAVTVVKAALRTVGDFRAHKAIVLWWKADFAQLPITDRRCRHELAGRVVSRTCDHQFDCRTCENYEHFAGLPAAGHADDLGMDYPADRRAQRVAFVWGMSGVLRDSDEPVCDDGTDAGVANAAVR